MSLIWEKKKIIEICRLINGKAYKKKELLNEGKYRVLRVGNLFNNKHWYHSDLELAEDKYIDKGDLIYAWSASFGPRIWTEEKVIYHYHIWKVIPDNKLVTKEFLYLLFQWDKEKIKKAQGTGTTMMHVGKGSMENREILLPPLNQQKQIVETLDKAFEKIDKAIANIERNIKNAEELFESSLLKIITEKDYDWVEKSLGECGLVQTGTTPKTSQKENYGSFIPFAKPPHFKKNGQIDTKESYLSEIGMDKSRVFPANSILMVCIGATIGKTGFSDEAITSNQQINGLTPYDEYHPRFFYYLFISRYVQKQIMTIGKGAQATLPIINKTKWSNIKLTLPNSIEKQKQIVEKLDLLSLETKKLEVIYTQKIADLEELKKSILEKAFKGELTSAA